MLVCRNDTAFTVRVPLSFVVDEHTPEVTVETLLGRRTLPTYISRENLPVMVASSVSVTVYARPGVELADLSTPGHELYVALQDAVCAVARTAPVPPVATGGTVGPADVSDIGRRHAGLWFPFDETTDEYTCVVVERSPDRGATVRRRDVSPDFGTHLIWTYSYVERSISE
jgi:hypothetical protein